MKPPEVNLSPRREVLVILSITIIGALLRLWSFDRLGLEHFDEGIYALSGLWIDRPGGLWDLDPILIPYAPPGLPMMIGLAYKVFGVSDRAAILVSILAGTITIALFGWLGRRAFGPGAGAASAGLLALAGPHIAFSRMALTDVLFLLAWLLAIGIGSRFLERPRAGRAIVFGVAVGIAQLCKYNGWISGMVVALVALLGLLSLSRESRRLASHALGWGLVSAVSAALVYLPWYLYVERYANYAALLEHHQSYLKGWDAWLPHLEIQLAQQVALSGRLFGPISWAAIGWGLAWTGGALAILGTRWYASQTVRWLVGLILGALTFGILPNAPWWIALFQMPWLLRSDRTGWRVIGVWWLVLSVLTPFYHPYARLWLPLHAASWLIVAGRIAKIVPNLEGQGVGDRVFRDRIGPSGIGAILGVLLAAVFQLGLSTGTRPLPGLLGPSDGLRAASTEFLRNTPRDQSPVTVDLLARPALTYYLDSIEEIQIRSFADRDALLRSPSPGRLVLLDEAQSGLGLDETPPGWTVKVIALDRLPIPVLLDLDPGASSTRSTSAVEARIWLLWTQGIEPFGAGGIH